MNRQFNRLLFLLHRLPRVPRQAMVEWNTLRTSQKRMLLGFDVRIQRMANPDAALQRLHDALLLIQKVDSRRFRRIQGDLSHIVIRAREGAFYWILTNTCVLEEHELISRSSAIAALTVIHEATHARLTAHGILPGRKYGNRLEHRCLQEEHSFVVLLREAGYDGADNILLWLELQQQKLKTV